MATGYMGNYEYVTSASMGQGDYINYDLKPEVDVDTVDREAMRLEIANHLGVADETVVTEDSDALLFVLVAPLLRD